MATRSKTLAPTVGDFDPFFRLKRFPHHAWPAQDILACHDARPHESDLSGDCVLAPVFGDC